MLLRSSDGFEFELIIIGYQFPETEGDFYDSNWLIIKVKVKNPQGSWDATGPFLEAFEAGKLATWLDAVAVEAPMISWETMQVSGRDTPETFPGLRLMDSIRFIEPNLHFKLVGHETDYAIIRVFFELEARPSWASASAAGLEDLWVDLRVPIAELKTAAQSLRSELSKYPVRAGNGELSSASMKRN